MVFASPSSQDVPGVVGRLALSGAQSSSSHNPSPSVSPPSKAQASKVPAQSQPLSKITSLIVVASPSSQDVPGVVGKLA